MSLKPVIRRPIQSNVRSEFGFGRDALFHAERLRKDYWKNYKDRSELRAWRNNLQRVRELSEVTNLEHQVKGLLGHMTEHSRHGYLVAEQSKLQKLAADIRASLPDSMKSS